MAEPLRFRRHQFAGRSIDLPASLTEAQVDGHACVRCGHQPEVGEAMRPAEACAKRQEARASA